MACNAMTIPVYQTEGLDAVLHILNDSGSRLLFLHDPSLVEDLNRLITQASGLELVILFEGQVDHPQVLRLKDLLLPAEKMLDHLLDERLAAAELDQTATLVYTSGTTGIPKGVALSHRTILSNVEACSERFMIGPDDLALSFLPLSHVFERVDGYYLMLLNGATIAYAENIDSVPNNLQEVSPTLAISVPRLFEKIYARIMERVLAGNWLKKNLFFAALRNGRNCLNKRLNQELPTIWERVSERLFSKLVFAKLHQQLGGKLRFFISGGAPLAPEIAEFFHAAGVPIYEGYGLTETAAGIAVNSPGGFRIGSVGRVVKGVDLSIAADGEILLRGTGVFNGYWQLPEKTADVLFDGWFHTGDIGEIDSEGFLKITDRKKDLLVTAGGKNVAPQYLENLFKTDKFLANALVLGDRKPYLTALLVPNFNNLENYAKLKRLPFLDHCDLVSHDRILNLVRRRIDKLQAHLPHYMQIKRFILLSADFSGKEITPTLKIRRQVVCEHFRADIERMYQATDHGCHDTAFCVKSPTANPPPTDNVVP